MRPYQSKGRVKMLGSIPISIISRFFTLVELLVVGAIISILMTMLLPALRKVKDTTKRVDWKELEKRQLSLLPVPKKIVLKISANFSTLDGENHCVSFTKIVKI